MQKKRKFKVAIILSILAGLYLMAMAFAFWGYAVAAKNVWPYEIVHSLYMEVCAFIEGGQGENKTLKDKLLNHIQEKRNIFDYGGFVLRDENFVDPGYVLISHFDRQLKQPVIELIQIDGFEVLYQWIPPIEKILNTRHQKAEEERILASEVKVNWPTLRPDGSIICHAANRILRLDKDNRIVWIDQETHIHHSLTTGPDGNIYANTGKFAPAPEVERLLPGYQDEGYAVYTPGGDMLTSYSATDILFENGYKNLVIGSSYIDIWDLLHINDCEPVWQDAGILKRGDVLLSLRNISTIAVFRPGTGEIVALKQGPWLYQHDPTAMDNGNISIFNNDIIFTHEHGARDHTPFSSVYIWNPQTNETQKYYQDILEKIWMHSVTAGHCEILDNGDVFIEESERNRLLRVAEDKVRWEYINTPAESPDITGELSGCTYYYPDEISLDWLQSTSVHEQQ